MPLGPFYRSYPTFCECTLKSTFLLSPPCPPFISYVLSAGFPISFPPFEDFPFFPPAVCGPSYEQLPWRWKLSFQPAPPTPLWYSTPPPLFGVNFILFLRIGVSCHVSSLRPFEGLVTCTCSTGDFALWGGDRGSLFFALPEISVVRRHYTLDWIPPSTPLPFSFGAWLLAALEQRPQNKLPG